MGNSVASSHLALKGQYQRPENVKTFIYKLAYLGHIFLLNTNRKSYMGSLMPPTDFTLGDLERSESLRFLNIKSYKGTSLVHYY